MPLGTRPAQLLMAEEYLRQVYYAQKQYRMDSGSYSISPSELGLAPFATEKIYLPAETTSRSFCAYGPMNCPLIITESGRLIRFRSGDGFQQVYS